MSSIGGPDIHCLEFLQLYVKDAGDLGKDFLRRMPTPEFDIRDKRRGAIEPLCKFAEREIKFVSAATHVWP